MGESGGRQIEVNAVGRKMRVLGTVEPNPGNNLSLTLDLETAEGRRRSPDREKRRRRRPGSPQRGHPRPGQQARFRPQPFRPGDLP